MTAKVLMPVPSMNLVVPLAHEATAMRTTETAAPAQARPGAVTAVIGQQDLRRGDVDSTHPRSTPRTTPSSRTSTTATRTTTTRRQSSECEPSADSPTTPFTFSALLLAYLDCARGKRNSISALAFEAHLERNLCDLNDQLLDGSYRPGRSICFSITRPKAREVWAADFRDRIVHHLFYNQVAERIHASFIANSCACIPGRGTLYAAQRLEASVRSVTQNWSRPAHYLKCDLANFFVAIDKHVLRAQLARRITEPFWLQLAETVLFHDPRVDVEVRGRAELLARVPPHKSLFNAPADTGLPIGNLSSQFFANVFLDALDQHCKHQLKARHYVRYVDDFILLHQSPQWLNAALEDITAWLPANLGAHLNPSKTILQSVSRGIDFVGFVVKPWRRTTRPRTLRSALHRIEHMPAADTFTAGNSYLGLVRQASHSHAEQAAIANALRRRGHAVKGDLSKVYRTTTHQRATA
jgi:RNA-directed DNA polymerase